jgi:hypothetical protein
MKSWFLILILTWGLGFLTDDGFIHHPTPRHQHFDDAGR